jgi:uncharacterized membrane protein
MIYGDGGGVDQHFNKFMEEFMKDGILEIGGNDTIPVWTIIPAGVALLGMFPICFGNGDRKVCSITLLILSILVAVFMPSILAGIEILAAENAPDTEAQVVVPDAEVAEVQADQVPDDAEVQADESLKTNTIVVASVGGGGSGILAGVGAFVATSGKKNKEIPTEEKQEAVTVPKEFSSHIYWKEPIRKVSQLLEPEAPGLPAVEPTNTAAPADDGTNGQKAKPGMSDVVSRTAGKEAENTTLTENLDVPIPCPKCKGKCAATDNTKTCDKCNSTGVVQIKFNVKTGKILIPNHRRLASPSMRRLVEDIIRA